MQMSAARMEAFLREALEATTVKSTRFGVSGGDTASGSVYEVDGKRVYVKRHSGGMVKNKKKQLSF